MNLERVSVALRPRGPWEAIDLGLSLARVHARAVWGAWALLVLPVHALLWLLLYRWPVLPFLLLWWLKPLFDRVPLAVLSQALFGDAPRPRALLRRGWLGSYVLRALTLSRLNPARGLLTPMWQLEGLDSRERASRQRVLVRGTDGGGVGLLLAFSLMETSLTLAGLGLAFTLLPENLGLGFQDALMAMLEGESPAWFTAFSAIAYTAATSLVEPLFVAGGFGLYVNRRTWLEGWDIELQLRRLARRLAAAAKVVLLLVVLGGVAGAQDTGLPAVDPEQEARIEAFEAPVAAAREAAGPPVDARAVAEDIDAVLAREEFPHEIKREVWRLKGQEEESRANIPPFLGFLGPILAWLVKGLVIVAAAVGLWLLVRAIRRARPGPAPEEEDPPDRPVKLPALVAELGPLPRDVPGEAWALWTRGRHAEALGLLYHAALLDLVTKRGLSIPEGATESDALRLTAGKLAAEEARYFTDLTRSWQAAAYAHRIPGEEVARALCTAWPRWYGRPA